MAKKKTDYVVVGQYKFVDDVKSALEKLNEQGKDYVLYSPVPNHELEDEVFKGKPRSPVRRFTLLGGVTGCLGAFLMTIWMSMDYPIRTSAKTIISIPAFVVVAFECTILLGALFTLASMFHFSRLPNLFSSPGHKRDFTKDVFGLVVKATEEETDGIKATLEQSGADDVEVEYVK